MSNIVAPTVSGQHFPGNSVTPVTPVTGGGGGLGVSLDSNGYKSGEQSVAGYLEGHHRKVVGRFTPAKRRSRSMAQYIAKKVAASPEGSIEREKLEKLGRDLGLCRNHLLFKDHFAEGKVTLSRMKSCKRSRLCPLCGIAHANAHVVTYHEKAMRVVEEYRAQGVQLRAWFVTLTVKHGVSLPDTYKVFSRSVQRLIDRRREAEKARKGSLKHQYALNSVMASVVAGVFSFEVKRGSGSGLWHPHTHGLLLSLGEISKSELKREWKRITGNSFIVDSQEVDVTDVKSLCEILKYSLKFSEMTLEDNFDAAMALQGRRFLRSFGEFYGLRPDANTDLDDATILDSPYIEMLYRYQGGSYRLVPGDGAVRRNGDLLLAGVSERDGDDCHTEIDRSRRISV